MLYQFSGHAYTYRPSPLLSLTQEVLENSYYFDMLLDRTSLVWKADLWSLLCLVASLFAQVKRLTFRSNASL